MCGITGIINPKTKDAIENMTEAIRHRGPDDQGYFRDERVALGMRRLSIIDLRGGRQPMTSPDGRFLIFFNGEIYNYQELRQKLLEAGQSFETESDTEVILRLFEVYGLECLSHLRGMFAFAIYDRGQHKLILVRDFFGIKPLYYFKEEGKIKAFASEIKSFLVLPDFRPAVNDAAVFNYLSFQYNPLEETFFKNVFKLPPAHFITIDVETGQAEIKKYWQFAFKPDHSLDEETMREKILKTMEDSVSHHMIADVPVGSFLSGGIDSSIIATLMQKIRGEKKIKTFTIGFDSLSEGREALETAGPLGTEHKEITIDAEEYFKSLPKVLWHFDEPVADPSAVGLYFLAREAAKQVKVVLSGEGSDELFGGYNIYLAPYAARRLAWLPKLAVSLFLKLPFEFLGKNYLRRVGSKLEDWYIGNASVFNKKEIKKLWRGSSMLRYHLDNLYQEARGLSDSTKMQYIDINTWLVGDILAKADKMTMAHSLELRVPFLDIKVAELVATLPDRLKWRGSTTKYLLREAFRTVLPAQVRRRKKLGFPTPLRDWLTKDRKDVYNIILGNFYIKSHMNVGYIVDIIKNHVAKKADNSRKIFLLLMLAIWYNTFIDGHS